MQRDGHIRLLPLHVANKIAAGEVVERPASVLKELLENAIDAGSTRIEATIVSGGRKLVSVRDDGCGMTREDALLSLERQATSKIRDVDDIEKIDTLGFRGEAIPSIASVSRFAITTRRHEDDSGTRLTVNAGILAEVKDCGTPPGTCIEVRDLFCNVPARRKFLRAYATEEGHIRSTFTLNALAHPDIGFTLILDGRETYRLPPGATLEERIRDLFGAEFSESLIAVNANDNPRNSGKANNDSLTEVKTGNNSPTGVKVHGYVERPASANPMRRDQFVFINGRPASASVITYALREAYPKTRDDVRPAIVLFIDLPPSQVDVNVHPAKREVRFRKPADVREAIISSITAAISPHASQNQSLQSFRPPSCQNSVNQDFLQNSSSVAPSYHSLPPLDQLPSASQSLSNDQLTSASQSLSNDQLTSAGQSLSNDQLTSAGQSPSSAFTQSHGFGNPNANAGANDFLTPFSTPVQLSINLPHGTPRDDTGMQTSDQTGQKMYGHTGQSCTLWRWFKFLAQTSSGYLLLETDSGIVTLDPRAARERIVYERVIDKQLTATQMLLIPETVQLPPADSSRIRNFLPDLQSAGFIIEEFGRDTWKVDGVPQIVSGINVGGLLASIANDIAELGSKRGSARWKEELIAKGISKSFAGASSALTPDAAVKLVNELSLTRMPYVTPRGKVVMIFTSNAELSRKFGK